MYVDFLRAVQGCLFLGKRQLKYVLSVYTNSGNALAGDTLRTHYSVRGVRSIIMIRLCKLSVDHYRASATAA
jgi:hypothetical protein